MAIKEYFNCSRFGIYREIFLVERFMKRSSLSLLTFFALLYCQIPTFVTNPFLLFVASYQILILYISVFSATLVLHARASSHTVTLLSATIHILRILKKVRLGLLGVLSLSVMFMCSYRSDPQENMHKWTKDMYNDAYMYPCSETGPARLMIKWMIPRNVLPLLGCLMNISIFISDAAGDGQITELGSGAGSLFLYTTMFYVGYGLNGVLFAQLLFDMFYKILGFDLRLTYVLLMVPMVGYLILQFWVVVKLVDHFLCTSQRETETLT